MLHGSVIVHVNVLRSVIEAAVSQLVPCIPSSRFDLPFRAISQLRCRVSRHSKAAWIFSRSASLFGRFLRMLRRSTGRWMKARGLPFVRCEIMRNHVTYSSSGVNFDVK